MLNGISGEIHTGQIILLRGENGSGKTTLLNILTGCLEPDSGTIEITSGAAGDRPNHHSQIINHKFQFPRRWHQGINPFRRFSPERVAQLGIGRTWQDVRLFPSLDLADNIAVASLDSNCSPWAALFRASRMRKIRRTNRIAASQRLAALGLPARDTSSADKISLGQSKRVAIARALQANARILLLDEPLAGLDADGIRDVITHLRTLATDHGLTLIIIEHVLNIPLLLDFVTKVWTLGNGQLTASAPKIVSQELAIAPAATNIHHLIQEAIGREVLLTTQALLSGGKLTTYWLKGQNADESQETILEIEDLTIQRGPHNLFTASADKGARGLTLRLHRGTVNVLEAPNGWGKSSLVNRIIGFLHQTGGTVALNGINLPDSGINPFFHMAGGRALLSSSKLFPSLSVAESVKLASCSCEIAESKNLIGFLSGGQLQRLAIRLLARPDFGLLDEFTQGLDSEAVESEMCHMIKQVLPSSSLLFLDPTPPNS